MRRLVFAYLGLCLLLASAVGLLYVTRTVWLEALADLWGRLARRNRRGYGRYIDANADRVGLITMGNGTRPKLGYSDARGMPPALSNGNVFDEELGDPFDAADDVSSPSGVGQRDAQRGSSSSRTALAVGVGGSQRADTGAPVNGVQKEHEADKGPE